MKKIVASISLVCYLVVSNGVVINFHYCMNRPSSKQLCIAEKENYGKCGMHTKKPSGCCHDKVKVVKLQLDQNTISGVSYNLLSVDVPVNVPSEFITAAFYNISEKRDFQNHSPPLLSEQDTYLQNSVFRI